MRDVVQSSPEDVRRIVWEILARSPGHRPTATELAIAMGTTALHLRRELHKQHATPMRELLTWSCLTYAVHEIKAGTKIEAAMWVAGFRNKTNFNRQCREFLGCLPSEVRRRSA